MSFSTRKKIFVTSIEDIASREAFVNTASTAAAAKTVTSTYVLAQQLSVGGVFEVTAS